MASLVESINARIAAAHAAPKTHKVVTTYASGDVREFEAQSLAAAESYAIGERRKIGRDLISRNADMTDGPLVRVVSVSVEAIQ